jgi:hypothetical protein
VKYAIIAISLSVAFFARQATAAAPLVQQQTSFCEDGAPDDLRKPTPLPSAIVATLMNRPEAKDVRKAQIDGKTVNPSTLFKGAKVRLTDSGDLFFLVVGRSPMSGADSTWFWIVRQSRKRAAVLLFAGANCVDISQKRTHGYRDIETTWSSASETRTETYRYNGQSYTLQQAKLRPKE